MKRLMVVAGLTILVLAVGCSSPPDATAEACRDYVNAFNNSDMEGVRASLNRMEELVPPPGEEPEPGEQVLDPKIYVVLLGNGPTPWEPVQYEILADECTDYLAES